MRRLTIYDIKKRVEETGSYYFARKTLKFFGQTLKDFRVYKCDDGRYFIRAPRKHGGYSERYYNPKTNKLENN
jgi:hypothetical protein